MFADRLKLLRKSKKLTQTEFASRFNIATGTIGMWETGKRIPDTETLKKLANFFDVSVDYLLGRTDVPKEARALDEQLKGVDFALYGETHDLTEEEKQDILEFVKYVKSKRKK